MTGRPPAAAPELDEIADDVDALRGAFAQYPSGVVALCARTADGVAGMVATSFSTGVSFAPPLVMFSVQNASATWQLLRTAPRIGISVLGHHQQEVSRQLASRAGDRFRALHPLESPDGAVFIPEATMWLDCEIRSETPAGDHQVVVLQVHRLGLGSDVEPLVYHRRAYHRLRETA